jgi:hypothetical protein
MHSRTRARATNRGIRYMRLIREAALGSLVEEALASVGLTSTRVSKWLGRPCACKERRLKLDMLGAWAKRTLLGKASTQELDELTSQ